MTATLAAYMAALAESAVGGLQRRVLTESPELRAEKSESGEIVISGVAVRYGDEARFGGGKIRERIKAGALKMPAGVVTMTRQHDRGRGLAAMTYEDTPDMLRFRATMAADPPAGTEQAQALYDIEQGILRGASIEIGMEDFGEVEPGLIEVRKATLQQQMSLVDRPAFPDSTFVMTRAADEWEKLHLSPVVPAPRRVYFI